jgi:oligopeptide transport system ATP-binding protein
MTSLNPTMTIGRQISEVLIKHQKISKAQARERTIDFLRLVHIANPERRYKEYPDSLSGGLRQRVVIAIAMCLNPQLILADEPTTALDVTIQAQILDLMRELQGKFNSAIMLITHDMGVVANMAHRVLVFYAGQIIEEGLCDDIFYTPKHPYTWGLLKSMPRLNSEAKENLVSIEGAPPDLFAPPAGCAFAARCDYAMNLCAENEPPMIDLGNGHCSKCWLNLNDMPNEMRPTWMKSDRVVVSTMGKD